MRGEYAYLQGERKKFRPHRQGDMYHREVMNKGSEPLEFTCCLHTYFRVGDAEACAVSGLKGSRRDTGIGSEFRGDTVPRVVAAFLAWCFSFRARSRLYRSRFLQ